MSKERRNKIIQIIIATVLFVVAIIVDHSFELTLVHRIILYFIPYIVSSYDVYFEAFEGLKEGDIFDEHFLMCIATLGAIFIGFFPDTDPELMEAVFVMLFFQVGELFEIIAEDDSENSINKILEIKADYANLEDEKGNVSKVNPETIRLFDTIIIKPYEKVPVDGEIIEGKSSLNTSALTGESRPKKVNVGDYIMSGCINNSGLLKVKVMRKYEDSTASKIIDMIENSNENKANADKFITKFSRVYTPLVILIAFLIILIPPLFTGEYVSWIKRSLSFLIVSCPCALVISVPLSYFGGIGAASKNGILIKGASYLEKLSKVRTVAFDKTGTLTKGNFEVVAIHPKEYNEKELLHLAAHVESSSNHPIAKSLKEAYDSYDNLDDKCTIKDIEELSGMGIKAKVNNDVIYVGDEKLMEKIKIEPKECHYVGTIVHVATEKKYLGHIIISDKIKPEAKTAVSFLKDAGIKVVMLTGDNKEVAKYVADKLGIEEYYYNLMPRDKVKIINKLIKKNKTNAKVAFIGDGINDAPVLTRSDLGISMGGLGSDAAIEASNIVIMDDDVSKIREAIYISQKTELIVKENISFVILVKMLTLFFAFLGYAPMWLAIFADVGVTVIAILNSLRTLKL
jgi:Cd2+/Zn2+-exporting ATPase